MVSNQRNQLAYGYNTDLKKISEIGFGLWISRAASLDSLENLPS